MHKGRLLINLLPEQLARSSDMASAMTHKVWLLTCTCSYANAGSIRSGEHYKIFHLFSLMHWNWMQWAFNLTKIYLHCWGKDIKKVKIKSMLGSENSKNRREKIRWGSMCSSSVFAHFNEKKLVEDNAMCFHFIFIFFRYIFLRFFWGMVFVAANAACSNAALYVLNS